MKRITGFLICLLLLAVMANAVVYQGLKNIYVTGDTKLTTWRIGGTTVSATAAQLNWLYGATAGSVVASKAVVADASLDALGFRNLSSTGTLTSNVTVTTEGNGAIVAAKCTVIEGGSHPIHQSVATFTLTGANDLDLADGADHGTGVKVYDFPAGRILILGATINGVTTITGAANGAATLPMALGTVAAADDGTLAGTEVNIIPSTEIANGAGTFKAALAASAQFDGTSSAVALYVNAAVTNAVSSAAVTIAMTGTATITWINLGDY